MDKTTGGIDYNREAFLPASQGAPSGVAGTKGVLLVLAGLVFVAFLCFVGYKATTRGGSGDTAAETREFVQLDMQISQLSDRVDQLEQENHHLAAAQAIASAKKPDVPAPAPAPAAAAPPRVIYRIGPTASQAVAKPDPATLQKLSAVQQGLSAAQNDSNANREAWQATTDRLADVAGQVGSEHGEILHSQDQLDQLLQQTSRSSLPFELHRGAAPQQLGPVAVTLKSTSPKNQRYTVCVFVQHECVELKDRTPYEVVQVAVSRNSPPLQVIATKVSKDGITGYLEVPREAGH